MIRSICHTVILFDAYKRFTDKMLYRSFHQLLERAGIARRSDGSRPRIHDLRHLFCVKALKQMEERGLDLYASLPMLSVYLGHKGIAETDYYLKLVEEDSNNSVRNANHYLSGLYNKKQEFLDD